MRNILFVEHDPLVTEKFRDCISGEEFNCFYASSGMEALEIMRSTEIALAIADLDIPVISGLEILEIIGHIYPDTVLIAISEEPYFENVINSSGMKGIFKFVVRPWEKRGDLLLPVREGMEYRELKKLKEQAGVLLGNEKLSSEDIASKIRERSACEMDRLEAVIEVMAVIIQSSINELKGRPEEDKAVRTAQFTKMLLKEYMGAFTEKVPE